MELRKGRQRFMRRLLLFYLLSIYFVSASFLLGTISAKASCSAKITRRTNIRSSSHARIYCHSQGIGNAADRCSDGRGEGAATAEEVVRQRRWLSGPGSSPPRCTSKCGKCRPCKPVHVPVPPGTPVTMEYYPETWRCKCGNKLYMP